MIISDTDFLSEKQVIGTKTTQSGIYDIGSKRDWGYRLANLYVNLIILGPHDKALTVDMMVREDATKAWQVIGTKNLAKTDLVRGKCYSMMVPAIASKYSQFVLQYRPDGAAASEVPTTGQTCPVDPFLDNPVDLKNGITAILSNNFMGRVHYPRANTDKVYTS